MISFYNVNTPIEVCITSSSLDVNKKKIAQNEILLLRDYHFQRVDGFNLIKMALFCILKFI